MNDGARAVTEHVARTSRHTTFYLCCGDPAGPPIIFVHGWPELSFSWRHQLACFGALGFRGVAPDMRGYGRTSAPEAADQYTLFHLVGDVIERVPGLGSRAAYVKQLLRDKLIDHKAWIEKHGEDMPEIRDWKWPY